MSDRPSDRDLLRALAYGEFDKGGPPDDDLLAAGLLQTADIGDAGWVQVSLTKHARNLIRERVNRGEESTTPMREAAESNAQERESAAKDEAIHGSAPEDAYLRNPEVQAAFDAAWDGAERLRRLEERAEDLQESLNIVCRHAEQACLAYESRSMPATLGRFRDVEDRIAALRNVIIKATEPCPPGGRQAIESMEALTVPKGDDDDESSKTDPEFVVIARVLSADGTCLQAKAGVPERPTHTQRTGIIAFLEESFRNCGMEPARTGVAVLPWAESRDGAARTDVAVLRWAEERGRRR